MWDGGGKIEKDVDYGYYKGTAVYDSYNDVWAFPELLNALTGQPGGIMGDVNDDSAFNVADAVALQRWLLADPSAELKNWRNGDFYKDNKLNVFDLCLMKRKLIYG